MTVRDSAPAEFIRWLDLTEHGDEDADSPAAIVRGQELYEAWALRADSDGVCILCAVQPRAPGSKYCAGHAHAADPYLT